MERILPIIGDADVYAANNPFMAHNHIEITRIDREEDGDYCAEVRVVLRPESMNRMARYTADFSTDLPTAWRASLRDATGMTM